MCFQKRQYLGSYSERLQKDPGLVGLSRGEWRSLVREQVTDKGMG